MKGDFSRIRFEPDKHYTDVLDQQGRVAFDADHNEQRFIDGHRRTVQTVDVIGKYGAPLDNAGFAISIAGINLSIGAGRYYVNGLLCENAAALAYDEQPYLIESDAVVKLRLLFDEIKRTPDACLRVCLQVWQRMVTALDDTCLGEPALGQADTTVRMQTVWRVVGSLFNPDQQQTGSGGCSCDAMYAETPPEHTGSMTALVAENGGDCGCQPIAAAGYTGQENQLYRIEVHSAGTLGTATFKWSRENGSVVVALLGVSGNKVTVGSLGLDANLGFQEGQWVEISDDTYTFGDTPNLPGALYQIQSIDRPSMTLTMTTTVATVDPGRHARMRRWDQGGSTATASGIPLSSGPIDLENGIQVSFGAGNYFAGDSWTVVARSATGTIDWPPCGSDGKPFQPPHYTRVYCAPLACIHSNNPASTPAQPPSTPSAPGAPVLSTHLASLATNTLASTLSRSDFIGSLASVAVNRNLAGSSVSTNPKAPPYKVDDCRRLFPSLTELGLIAAKALHITGINWKNDDVLSLDALASNGLVVTFDQPPTGPLSPANFVVTLENVVSTPQGNQTAPTVLEAQIIDGAVSYVGNTAVWKPFAFAQAELALFARRPDNLGALAAVAVAAQQTITPTRMRVKLPGTALYTTTASGQQLYLDGQAFGQTAVSTTQGRNRVDLQFPSGDNRRASDFDSWFYLYPALAVTGVTFAYQQLIVVQANLAVQIVGSEPATTPPPTSQQATITVSYAALADTAIQLSLTAAGPAGAPPITNNPCSVPSQVTIPAGQTSVQVTVSINALPSNGVSATITLIASLPSATGQAASQSAQFLLLPRQG